MLTSIIQCGRAGVALEQCTFTPPSDIDNTEMFNYILMIKVVKYQINIQLELMKTGTDIVFNLNFITIRNVSIHVQWKIPMCTVSMYIVYIFNWKEEESPLSC